MLFSIGVFWIFLFFFSLRKIKKTSFIGILLSLGGLPLVYFSNISSPYTFINGTFGILSGIIMATITILTSFMIEKDPPFRIGLYHSLTGFILSSIVLFFLEVRASEVILPSFSLVKLMIFSGLIFALALFLFLKSFYYTDAYTLSAVTCLLPLLMVVIDYVLNKTPVQWQIIIGVIMMALGGIVVIGIVSYNIILDSLSSFKKKFD